MKDRSIALRTFGVTSVALIMVMLDNLVVSTALNVIRQELGATLEQLEWTVNAYTLTFAVLLLTGAALGDRFGRRRMFIIGVAIFTAASAAAAMSTTIETLIIAPRRAGRRRRHRHAAHADAAVRRGPVGPARPRARRPGAPSAASRSPSGRSSVAPSSKGSTWNWIFWVNVPIGLALIPLAWFALRESHGPAKRLDLPGVVLASVGLLGIVWALVNGNSEGWTSPPIVASFAAGVARPRRLRPLGAPLDRPDAAAPLLRQPRVQPREPVLVPHELRDVRGHLPAGPVPPVRALLLPARGGRSRSCPGRSHRCSWRPSRAPSPTASAAGCIMGVGLTLQAIGLAWLGASSRPRPSSTPASSCRSSSPASAWACSSPRWPTCSSSAVRPERGRPGVGRQQRHP